MSIQGDSIKKLRVRYLKCNKGDLHEGEVLNFICIDPSCKQKGLICPVCQSTTHEKHQTLHLKVFLSQISKNLYSQQQQSQLNGLAEYLVSLDNSKKQMIKSLKQVVEQLALKVKEIQNKIEDGYKKIRRTVLSQSTISMRLPELYRLLTDKQAEMDQNQIYRQIGRYSELLEYKDDKIITVDSVKNLVNQYSSKGGILSAQLLAVVDETSKIFNNLPLDVSKFGSKIQNKENKSNLVFSSSAKSTSIILKNEKQIILNQQNFGGIAFVDSQGQQEKKCAFKILSSPSCGAFTIGVANIQNIKSKNYEIDYQSEIGMYGLCSYGVLPEQLEGEGFPFGVGDTIDVTWNPKNQKLTFSRRHGVQKCTTTIPVNLQEAKKCCLFVSLTGPNDSISIVE